MVSFAEPRRRERLPLTALITALLLAGLLSGCSRRAEVEDAPVDQLPSTPEVPTPEGGVPVVDDSGLDVSVGSCEGRAGQPACAGANDFLCVFDRWLIELSETCQTQTGCRTNGWLEVAMGPEGCATELRMDKPNPEFVACVTEQLNQHRCSGCPNVSASQFLGAAREGCQPEEIPCSTGELRCPTGLICDDGLCIQGAAGASGG
jgi:hypothetical protein